MTTMALAVLVRGVEWTTANGRFTPHTPARFIAGLHALR